VVKCLRVIQIYFIVTDFGRLFIPVILEQILLLGFHRMFTTPVVISFHLINKFSVTGWPFLLCYVNYCYALSLLTKPTLFHCHWR